jgi:tetratricopeptide (TPR) repeat protein
VGGVFVNYRFADERFGAGAVYDGLVGRFGTQQVFRDCVSMQAGEHYPTELRQALEDADILVAVIGPTWLDARNGDGVRRLDLPNDWVRYEIRRALQRGIPIVPVLTAGTTSPGPADLPDDITAVSRLQAHPVSHRQLTADVGALADRIAVLVPDLAVRELFAQAQALLADQPSALLRAEHAVVPFAGRGGELARLWAWAMSPAPLSVRLVTGPGGQGKTRLAHRLCEQLRGKGYLAGLVRDDAPGDVLHRCAGLSSHTLLVVDYAETRTDQLRTLATDLLGRRGPAAPVRLLLLARTGGEWLRPLVDDHRDPRIVALFQPVAEHAVELTPLLPAAMDRQKEFTRAVNAFASRLGRDGTGVPAPFDLDDDRYARALDLHAAALAALLDREVGYHTPSTKDPILRVLHHEYHYWARTAETFTLPDPHTDRLHQIAAAATLFGASDDTRARDLLSSLRTLAGQPADTVDRYLRWLQRLYPGPQSLNPMQPDRLGEDHSAATVRAEPTTASNPVPIADPAQLTQAITVLGRAAPRHDQLTAVLTSMMTLAPDKLLTIGVQVVPQLEDPYPLVRALTSVAGDREDLGALAPALDALPGRSVALTDFAVTATDRALAIHRTLPDPNPMIIAVLLTKLSTNLEASGRLEPALTAIDDAISLYRRLDPSPVRQADLIRCLHSKALLLSRMRRRADAVTTGAEAVELSRVAGADPADLALSLTIVALEAGDQGEHERAVAAAAEASSLYRGLAANDPASYAHKLAASLNTVAIQSERLGRGDDEAKARAEANAILRTLAATAPDTYRHDLALSLQAEAIGLSGTGDTDAALAAAHEAVDIERYLDELEPDVHRPDLGAALSVLGVRQSAAGLRAEAISTLGEAAGIFRGLTARLADAYQPRLAETLRALAVAHRQAGDVEHAIVTGTEAVESYRRIITPDAYLAELAGVLRAMATWLNELGRPAEAVDTATQALTLYTGLAARDPEHHNLDVAVTLSVQAVALNHAGHDDHARDSAAGAVALYRAIPGAETFLAEALHNYALLLIGLGESAEAEQRQQEAVAVLTGDPRHRDMLRDIEETWRLVNPDDPDD